MATKPDRRPGAKGGLLLTGGKPGNKGGGRPKSKVREACQAAFDKRIRVLEGIADDKTASPAERIKAIDVLGKYGGLQQIDQTSGDEALKVLYLPENAI